MSSPKVSVVVLVYKTESFIRKCVKSLFEQTLQNIEYIFVDDCSPDNSISIVEEMLSDYPMRKNFVKIIRNKKNLGQAFSRKIGMQNATGEYVIHCDSDDWVDLSMYEKLYTYAVENDCDMVWCDYYRSDGVYDKHIPQVCTTQNVSLINGFLNSELIASLCNRIFRRTLYERADFVYPQANMTEDFVMVLQMTLNSKKIGYIHEPLYYYYENPDSICLSLNEEKVIKNYVEVVENTELVISIIAKNNLSSLFRKQIVCKKFFAKEALVQVLHKKEYRELWKKTYREINKFILFNRYIPINSKIRAVCLFMGWYRVYKMLQRINNSNK